MATKKPSVGQINTYVPTVRKEGTRFFVKGRAVTEEVATFLKRAAWKIPSSFHEFALHLDGSNWTYQSAFLDRAKAVKDEFDTKHGVKIYLSEKIEWENDGELWRMIQDATVEAVDDIKESLKGSLATLVKRFDELESTDADGLIVDRINEAKGKLKRLSFVMASLALSDDFREGVKGIEEAIEAGLVATRLELGRRFLAANK
jgi:hypothetical protein